MLKLKLQNFVHLVRRADSLEKDPGAGKGWRQAEKGTEDEMVGCYHLLSGQEFEPTLRWWRTGKPGLLHCPGSQRFGHDWATEQQQRQEANSMAGSPGQTDKPLKPHTPIPPDKSTHLWRLILWQRWYRTSLEMGVVFFFKNSAFNENCSANTLILSPWEVGGSVSPALNLDWFWWPACDQQNADR